MISSVHGQINPKSTLRQSRKLNQTPHTRLGNQDGRYYIQVHHQENIMELGFSSPLSLDHMSPIFLAHSPRICEITLNVHPHPIKIFCLYAPSTVEDSQEDLTRKFDFWECLDSIIDDNKNSKYIYILLGDLNSRLYPVSHRPLCLGQKAINTRPR